MPRSSAVKDWLSVLRPVHARDAVWDRILSSVRSCRRLVCWRIGDKASLALRISCLCDGSNNYLLSLLQSRLSRQSGPPRNALLSIISTFHFHWSRPLRLGSAVQPANCLLDLFVIWRGLVESTSFVDLTVREATHISPGAPRRRRPGAVCPTKATAEVVTLLTTCDDCKDSAEDTAFVRSRPFRLRCCRVAMRPLPLAGFSGLTGVLARILCLKQGFHDNMLSKRRTPTVQPRNLVSCHRHSDPAHIVTIFNVLIAVSVAD